MFGLTGHGIEPQTFRADSDVFNHYANRTMELCGFEQRYTVFSADPNKKNAYQMQKTVTYLIFLESVHDGTVNKLRIVI